jgi:hypothetical protein
MGIRKGLFIYVIILLSVRTLSFENFYFKFEPAFYTFFIAKVSLSNPGVKNFTKNT